MAYSEILLGVLLIENEHFHCSAHATYLRIMTNAYVILHYILQMQCHQTYMNL